MMVEPEGCDACFDREMDTIGQLQCGCPDCLSNAEHSQEVIAQCACLCEPIDVAERHWQLHHRCEVEDGCGCAELVAS